MAPKDPEASTERSSLLPKNCSTVSTSTSEEIAGERGITVMDDVYDTFKLGVPIFWSMLSWVGVRANTGYLTMLPLQWLYYDGRLSAHFLFYSGKI